MEDGSEVKNSQMGTRYSLIRVEAVSTYVRLVVFDTYT